MKDKINFKENEDDALIEKIIRFCAYRERCSEEVRKKLSQLGVVQRKAADFIKRLEAWNYLNDERFAESFVKGKFRIKKWGKNKIRFELKSMKIKSEYIDSALSSIDEEEYKRTLENLAAKKLKTLAGKVNFQEKAGIARFLVSKGFETSMVYEILSRDI